MKTETYNAKFDIFSLLYYLNNYNFLILGNLNILEYFESLDL